MRESRSRREEGSGARAALWWRSWSGNSGKRRLRAWWKSGMGTVRVTVLKPGGVMTSTTAPGWNHPSMSGPWVMPKWNAVGCGWAGGDVDECVAVWGHGAVEGEARAEAGGVEGAAREGDAGEFADGGNGGELAGIEASAADGTDELFGVGEAGERSAGGGFHGGRVRRGVLRNKEGMGWECAIRILIDAEWVGQAGGVPARSAVSDYRTLCIHEKISSSLSDAAAERGAFDCCLGEGGSGGGVGPDGAADS